MNYKTLKSVMYDNPEIITNILHKYNIEYQIFNSDIRFRSEGGRNITSCRLKLDEESLPYVDFKKNTSGDIFTLLQERTHLPLRKIASDIYLEMLINKPVIVHREYDFSDREPEIIEYPSDLIEMFPKSVSSLFLEDDIEGATQFYFDIRYDKRKNRILIPIYKNGVLVGINGRINNKYPPESCPKYYTYLPYPKSKVLYGWDINKDDIMKSGSVILVESEKSVMKAFQAGIRNILAVGSSFVSKYHISQIKEELGINNILVCFDKGYNTEFIYKNINKIKSEDINFYLFDANLCEELRNKECLFDKQLRSKEEYIRILKSNTRKVKGT